MSNVRPTVSWANLSEEMDNDLWDEEEEEGDGETSRFDLLSVLVCVLVSDLIVVIMGESEHTGDRADTGDTGPTMDDNCALDDFAVGIDDDIDLDEDTIDDDIDGIGDSIEGDNGDSTDESRDDSCGNDIEEEIEADESS